MIREILESNRAKQKLDLLQMDDKRTDKLDQYFKKVWKMDPTMHLGDRLNTLDDFEFGNVYKDFIKKGK